MKNNLGYILFFIISSFTVNSVYADSLGRIFTSAKDRQKLEQLRNKKEESIKTEVVEIEKEEPVVSKKEIIEREPIALKGLVHREGGKNTAWINDGNTFEGNLDSEFIQIPNNEIKSDQVTIILSEDNAQLDLKVGDVVIPEPIEKELFESQIYLDE